MTPFKFQHGIQLLLLLNMCACAQIKGYFPDKLKDYQLAQQIPVLQIPADFLPPNKQAITDTVKPPVESPVESPAESPVESPVKPPAESPVKPDNPVNPPSANTIKLTYLTDEARTHIDDPRLQFFAFLATDTAHIRIRLKDSENGMASIWRFTEKALLRHAIEIVGRDEADGVYFVQYDADFTKITDGSLWDEIRFFFAPDPAQEKAFNIKLSTRDHGIEITIVNSHQTLSAQDASLSQAYSLKLLNILYQEIKQDLTSE